MGGKASFNFFGGKDKKYLLLPCVCFPPYPQTPAYTRHRRPRWLPS